MRNDGVLFICVLRDISENGEIPHEVLTRVSRYWFEIRTIGINRQYLAKGVNERVDLLVRILFDTSVRIGQYALLGNGEQFRIDNVSYVTDDDGLRETELTLSRVENYYDVED